MKPNEAGVLTIALIGSPNSGKSALFNQLSGAKQKVANYAGVTVERKEGAYVTPGGRQVRLIDLPGLYSLSALGQDEAITRQILQDQTAPDKRFDLILCVVDATNLRLHLKLLLELKQLVAGQGLPVAVILNQIDMAEARGISIDRETLVAELGCPVIPTVAVKPSGIADLTRFIENFDSNPPPQPTAEPPALAQDLHARVRAILRAAVVMPRKTARLDDRLDRIFLHPIGGMILLLLVLFVVFQSVFLLAQPFMDGILHVFERLKLLVDLAMPPSLLHSFVTEAVISGSGAVLIFLPQIIILFFFILVLEESGYLPRAAFLLDTIMAKFGLSGRSFIPLLSSFACAIPGIMATRTIHDRRDRVTTILVAPLMTCSARLPVYGLLIAAFIPEQLLGGFISLQGLVLFCLYFAGIFSAALVAKLITQHQSRQFERSLILELPSYRLPQLKNLAYGLWERALGFVKRISGIIFGVNALLWFLVSFPRPDAVSLASGIPAIQSSFAGMIGAWLQPIMAPVGFGWQITVALIPGLAAREVAVSALGTVYAVAEKGSNGDGLSLGQLLSQNWSLATALSLLAWYVFAPQCLATLAVIRRETNSVRLTVVAATYLFVLAYLAAFLTYQISLNWIG